MTPEQYEIEFNDAKNNLFVGKNVQICNTNSEFDGMYVKVLNIAMATLDAPTIIVGGEFSDGSLAITLPIFCVK